VRIPVTGMSCQGCAQTIQESLRRLPGAHDVHVNFALKELQFEGLALDAVLQTIRQLGYDSPGPVSGAFKVPEIDAMAKSESSVALVEFLVAAVLGIPELGFGMGRFGHGVPHVIQAALTTAVVIGAGFGIHKRALKQLFKGQLTMDTLVSMGSVAALLEGYLLWLRGSRHAGFETASTIILFILLGRYLEARARRGTFSATAELFKAFQQPVIRIAERGEEKVLGLDLKEADRVVIRPGEIFPADGVIIDGTGLVNEASVTGEPLPRTVKAGDSVLSGTVVLDSPLTILVKRAGVESFLGRLLTELETAEGRPAELQRLADRVTGFFVPAVILTASFAALAQFFLKDNPELAFHVFMSVILVACPCALGLAIPTALVAGLGASAKSGILFKDAAVLEACSSLTDIYFDKTGTLTIGAPKLTTLEILGGVPESEILSLAASLEKGSVHPLAKAIIDAAAEKRFNTQPITQPITQIVSLPGQGITGSVGGHNIKIVRSQNPSDSGQTQSEIYIDGTLAARASFTDQLRGDTLKILNQLKDLHFRLHLLTGDRRSAVSKLNLENIFDSVQADLLPEDKGRIIEAARKTNPAAVAFVGDGINDVLALRSATVGFAIAAGAPAALGAAGVTLSRGLGDLPRALAFAGMTHRQLKYNLFWAFVYNGVMLPWAALGGFSPMWAASAMAASSVSVVSGSLFLAFRLRRLQV